jgi:hypothetical protein
MPMPKLQNVLPTNLAASTTMCHRQIRNYTCGHQVTRIKKCKNFNEETQTPCPGTIEYSIEVLDSICPKCMRLELSKASREEKPEDKKSGD